MTQTFRFIVSEAVDMLLQLDSVEHVKNYGIALADRQPKRGTAIEGTLDQLESFAKNFLVDATETQDDISIQARRGAEKAGEKLLAFVSTLRAQGVS